MAKKLKIDLHTHPFEALKEKMGIKSILDIKKEAAAVIVNAVKSAGLDGIAITEHNNFNYGWVAGLEIMDHFGREGLIILPGIELEYQGQQYLSLYIPPYVRRGIPFFKEKEWFTILAHPGYYNPLDLNQVSQPDYDAVEAESLLGRFTPAAEISRRKEIPDIAASNAHRLEDIGLRYMELEANIKRKDRRKH